MTVANTRFELDSYLTRIRHEGSLDVSVPTLFSLVKHHVQAISFENIDILLGRDISLQTADVFNKLVTHQHGGYCFEQNILFYTALSLLGFDVSMHGGRVRIGEHDRQQIPARTHLFLKIHLDHQDWLVDVGFGSYSLTSALLLKADQVQTTPHGLRRLQKVQGRWFHQGKIGDDWVDLYEFDLNPMFESDQKIANWYTQSSPLSHFTYRLSVARATEGGGRIALRNRRFRCVDKMGTEHIVDINSATELAQVLTEDFLLARDNDIDALWQWLLHENNES